MPPRTEPSSDRLIFDDDLSEDWQIEAGSGVDLSTETVVVFEGDRAGLFQVQESSGGWDLAYEPIEAVDPFGYDLHFAFRPVDVEVDDRARFSLTVPPGGTVNLLEEVDLSTPEWQIVNVALPDAQTVDSINAIRFSGNFGGGFYLDDMRLTVAKAPITTAVEEEFGTVVPDAEALFQNYPNPFNSETVIQFQLARPTSVALTIHNLLGQTVATLARGRREARAYTLSWDGLSTDGLELASGVYLYRLSTDDRVQLRKLLLLR